LKKKKPHGKGTKKEEPHLHISAEKGLPVGSRREALEKEREVPLLFSLTEDIDPRKYVIKKDQGVLGKKEEDTEVTLLI